MFRALFITLLLGLVAAPSALASPLDWSDCDDGLECATARVPLDYDKPSGKQISLAVIRRPASDPARRIGSLFVNNGGPGNSAVDFVRRAQSRLPARGARPLRRHRHGPARRRRQHAGALRSQPLAPAVPRGARRGARVRGRAGRAGAALPRPQRRPARPPVVRQRGARPRPAAAGRRRPEADLRRPLVRNRGGRHLRQPVPRAGARDRARLDARPGRPTRAASARSRCASAASGRRRTRCGSSSTRATRPASAARSRAATSTG